MNYVRLPKLSKQSSLFHAFSTKEAGNFGAGLNLTDEIIKKRSDWLERFDINFADVVTIQVVYGTDVLIINKKHQKLPIGFDSVITNLKNVYLMIAIADCLPVIIYDPKRKVLGLAHAGWQGLSGGIIGKTIDRMVKVYGISPQDLIVGIGPSIHKDSYIKDKSFREKISAELNKFVSDFDEKTVKVDLTSAALNQLESSGVERSNIEVSSQDTFSDNYFSHHRSKIKNEPDGRNLAVVGMR